ncbi:MAG: hypothetical protein O3A00_08655 [Planctomycetota bacterium]|nr:hypothetical protein [Planctomycetota bacterium]
MTISDLKSDEELADSLGELDDVPKILPIFERKTYGYLHHRPNTQFLCAF